MKKLTGIVAVAFVAGVIGGGIDERVADEVWTSKTALAASDKFSEDNCDTLKRFIHVDGLKISPKQGRRVEVLAAVMIDEHC